MRKYDQNPLNYLANEADTVVVNGTAVITKKSPGEGRPGYLDPWDKATLKPRDPQGDTGQPPDPSQIPFILRKMRETSETGPRDLCETKVSNFYEELTVAERKVGLWRYEKASTRGSIRSCYIHIHGGGKFLGTADDDGPFCRFLAEKSGEVVFNVDYSLSPEVKFPVALEECYAVLLHISKNAQAYGIDKEKIIIAGGSSGGNLAAGVTLMAKDKNGPKIAAQVLLVPYLLISEDPVKGYEWREEDFNMVEDTLKYVEPMADPVKAATMIMDWYIAKEQRNHKYASPMLYKNFAGLPKALIITSEFDALRPQGEFYGSQLSNAGVETRIIRYMGVTHSAVGKLGNLPQAEDCFCEIANFIKEL